MPITMQQLVRRHGAFAAAVTALATGTAMVALALAQTLVVVMGLLQYPDQNSPQLWSSTLGSAALVAIPFAVGFFVSLWIVAPIAEELRIGHVITRAVLATGIASTVVFVVLALIAIGGAVRGLPLGFDGGSAVDGLMRSLQSALGTFVSNLPLSVLAGVLLWVWRKDNPPRKPLSGLIDEV